MRVKYQLAALVFLLWVGQFAWASVNKELWPRWGVTNPLSEAVIPHHEWQVFLSRRVIRSPEGINLIDYPAITRADKILLQRYISRLSKINIANYNRQEQLAYWLNLYNALTVQIVAKYYPVDSIQDINISPGLFSIGPWQMNIITINGTELSLEDIHNRIIRPIWNDPRTHYALNNATIGAANLSKVAFNGKKIEQQLNQAASSYINSLRGTQVIEGKLIVSKLFDWYREDFGGTQEDVIKHLKCYANPPLRNVLSNIDTISTYSYNWHLNTTIEQS